METPAASVRRQKRNRLRRDSRLSDGLPQGQSSDRACLRERGSRDRKRPEDFLRHGQAGSYLPASDSDGRATGAAREIDPGRGPQELVVLHARRGRAGAGASGDPGYKSLPRRRKDHMTKAEDRGQGHLNTAPPTSQVAEKGLRMLREPQHERKIMNNIKSPPYVLSGACPDGQS